MRGVGRKACPGISPRSIRATCCRDDPASEGAQMKLPAWIKLSYLRKAPASFTKCPACGDEMRLVDRSSMSGNDMRSYRCDRCQKEHIVDLGPALWKILSDARKPDE
jgi:predicted RNA-binding Zn-ribbon protein involved in translation (DUF1610 family)